jgi:hypothetical protein
MTGDENSEVSNENDWKRKYGSLFSVNITELDSRE